MNKYNYLLYDNFVIRYKLAKRHAEDPKIV